MSARTLLPAPAALLFVGVRTDQEETAQVAIGAGSPLPAGTNNASAAGQYVNAYFDRSAVVCIGATAPSAGFVTVDLRGYLIAKP